MRDIKFRVWEVSEKEMEYWTFKDLCSSMSQSMGESADGSDESFYEEFKVMQYTGLKDKNNKEIYEGDIVEVRYFIGGHATETFIEAIKWTEQGWDFDPHLNGWPFQCAKDSKDGDMKIIGNIYQNPELMEKYHVK